MSVTGEAKAPEILLPDLRDAAQREMRETEDPLLDGLFSAPPGVELNAPDQLSPNDPKTIA